MADEQQPKNPADQPDEGQDYLAAFEAARDLLREIRDREPYDQKDAEVQDALHQAQVAWLELKWHRVGEDDAPPPCPYCGNQQWAVDVPISMKVYGGKLRPMFPVICTNCSHTTFISSVYSDQELFEEEAPTAGDPEK